MTIYIYGTLIILEFAQFVSLTKLFSRKLWVSVILYYADMVSALSSAILTVGQRNPVLRGHGICAVFSYTDFESA